jgi:hypothetical protein
LRNDIPFTLTDTCIQGFLRITEIISQSNIPLIHEVIPLIDMVQNMVDNIREDKKIHPVVRSAVQCASKVVDKYYSKTDEAEIYRVAMGKHIFCCIAPV